MKRHQSTDLTDLLEELVAFPTIGTDTATNRAALDWFKYQTRHLPLQVHDLDHHGTPGLILTTKPTKHPKVMLMAHLDVVPGPPELFTMRRVKDRLYGRGVLDMKPAVAVYLKLLLELGDTVSQYDLGIMLTSDEELARDNSSVRAIVHQGWRADVFINPDAGINWELERAAKGVGRFVVESRGLAAHGSRPWLGQNALVQLMAYLQEVQGAFPLEPCGDPNHAHNTINIGIIQGGNVYNQVADYARAEVDVRVMPDQLPQAVEQLFMESATHYQGITASLEGEILPFENDPDNEYMRLAELLITKITGHKPRLILSHGGTDARYYNGLGIPFIMTQPIGAGSHSNDEWVDAKGLEQFYRFVSEFVRQVAKTPFEPDSDTL